MNFLAHLYLSGDNDEIRLGNFFADAVKGNAMNRFPLMVKNGIILHRFIDSYTDNHAIVKKSIKRLQPSYHKYAGIVVDLYYAHFLAANWKKFSTTPLHSYTTEAYKLLMRYYFLLPDRSKRILPFMITYNWLEGYASLKGLQQVFNGMARRTGFPAMRGAISELQSDYGEFKQEFMDFFPEIMRASENHLGQILTENDN
jgi:acyl carrier protein phosphodiesterase